ncbi:hypothetical protein DFH07DRAFT_689758, partial [Mycena maculata]
GRKRPARTLGLTASNSGALIPEGIRKKFSGPGGWKTHVPFHYLTDKACSFTNHAAAKELNDLFTVDSSSGALLSTPKELPFEPELSLSFDEWFQAHGRLLELIEAYHQEELGLWVTHFDKIIHRPHRAQNWAVCLEYNSIIRRHSCVESIDPSEFHSELWDELASAHPASRTLAIVRRELQGKQGTGRSGSSHTDGDHAGRSKPYDNQHSFRPSGKFRCFVCGDDDPTHKSRSCKADRLVTGKPVILIQGKDGGSRKDRSGQAYCFNFNGNSGCARRNNCPQGKHWCSLCGARN